MSFESRTSPPGVEAPAIPTIKSIPTASRPTIENRFTISPFFCPSVGASDPNSEAVALFLPVVRVVVVAVALPEPRLVGREELEAAQPLRALPEVTRRDDEPERPPMLGLERFAVGFPRDQRLVVLERLPREAGGETLLRLREHEARARLRADERGELTPADAAEARVEPAPTRDAVNIDRDLGLRQRLQLVVRQRHGLLDLAGDLEVPRRKIRLRHGAGVQHRPLLGEVLARGQPGRVEPLVDQFLLGLASEERHRGLH